MRVHHIAFRTKDLERLERFYVSVLGFAVRSRQGSYSVWLEMGGAILMIERAEESEPAIPKGSMELVAFAVDAATKQKLAGRVVIEAETPFTTYFRDPDGRRVALSHYPLEK